MADVAMIASRMLLILWAISMCSCARDGNPVPTASKERIIYGKYKLPAEAAMYCYGAPYDDTCKRVQTALANAYGIATRSEGVVDNNARLTVELAEPSFAKQMNDLKARGASVMRYHVVMVRTNRYNLQNEIGGSSELRVRLVDGRDVLGTTSTVVIFDRKDRWRAWGREFHTGIPIPLRLDTDTFTITSTEVALLSTALGESIEGGLVFPDQPYEPLFDLDAVEQLCGKCGRGSLHQREKSRR